jgi:hypothetical protein
MRQPGLKNNGNRKLVATMGTLATTRRNIIYRIKKNKSHIKALPAKGF